MRTTDFRLVVILSLCAASAIAAADPPARILAYSCTGCHGTDGSSVGLSNPHIAGMNKEYFIESMEEYQLDRRNSTVMNRLAKAYTSEQIAAMAEFFAQQPLRLRPQQHDAAKAQVGAEHHAEYCEKCHEDGGRSAGDTGTLAGQWAPYLRFSMADYISGEREMTRKMRKKVEKMLKAHGDEAVDALIHYYASHK